MNIRQLLLEIESKKVRIIDLAKKYGVSDRTIQNKIKNLGFKWNAKKAAYELLEGADKKVYDLEIDNVFNGSLKVNNRTENASKNNIKKNIENNSKKDNNNEEDLISEILFGDVQKKSYRGFYLDDDVLSVVDKVKGGRKSKLVNECLREAFKKRGIL